MHSRSLFALLILFCASSCVLTQKYPRNWAEREAPAAPSGLSGTYAPAFLELFAPYMNGKTFLGKDTAGYRVRFQINDSLHYSVWRVQADDRNRDMETETLLFRGQSGSVFGPNKVPNCDCRVSQTENGLRFEHDPTYGRQHTLLGIPFSAKEYLVLSRNKDGELVVESGQRGFYLFFFFIPVIIHENDWVAMGNNGVHFSNKRIKKRL